MKAFKIVANVLVALTAVAGAVYVAATYGDRIVAWAKKLLSSCPCSCNCCEPAEEAPEAPVEEVPVEEVPAEEAPAEEAPVEEAVVPEDAVVADEADFEG